MKKLMSLFVIGAVMASVSTASAAEFSLFGIFDSRNDEKTPDEKSPYGQFVSLEELPPAPMPIAAQGQPPAPQPQAQPHLQSATLFHAVKYEDHRNIHPCAVEKIVAVKDPCWKPDPCSCQPQCAPCVLVKICVPPCGCPEVKVSKKGSKVKYDYGKYEVEISSKKGYVKVDYDD